MPGFVVAQIRKAESEAGRPKDPEGPFKGPFKGPIKGSFKGSPLRVPLKVPLSFRVWGLEAPRTIIRV